MKQSGPDDELSRLRADRARLREELWLARRIRWAVDRLPEQVAYVDHEQVFRYVNDAYVLRYPGLSRDDILGKAVADVLPASLYDAIRQHIEAALAGRPVRYDAEAHGEDGQSRHFLATYIPDHRPDGNVRGFFALISDVSDVKRLERRLIQREKLETIGQLASGLAHDFNNVLASVLGSVDLALLEQQRERPRQLLERAREGCLDARRMTTQLLGFTQVDEASPQRLDVGKLLERRVGFTLHGSPVAHTVDVDDDLWPVDADATQLGRAVDHLVLNARDALAGEGGCVRVSAFNTDVARPPDPEVPPGRFVCVSVADDGPGIPASQREAIFDPFFSTKPGGTGLGLAAVYAIARDHGGHVEVRTEVGQGAEFRLLLPAAAGEAPDDADAATTTSDEIVKGKGRVLVMDDEQTVREVATEILHALGYEAAVAPDGQAALDAYFAARENGPPFDAVVLDLTVPGGMGGRETMEHLLALDPDACVLVSSGYSADPVMARWREHGFRGVIPKPYRVAEFARVLHDALDARRGP